MLVSETLQNGVPAFYLHALDLTNGAEQLNGPAAITGTVPSTADDAQNGTLGFDPQQHIQRPGLLLANDSIYAAFGSHADEYPWHGWLMRYDAADVSRQIGVFNTTPGGAGGAIWQSGRGLAADDQGSVYAITGNGDYDGVQNFSESFLRFAGEDVTRLDWFTPGNWAALTDDDSDLSAGGRAMWMTVSSSNGARPEPADRRRSEEVLLALGIV